MLKLKARLSHFPARSSWTPYPERMKTPRWPVVILDLDGTVVDTIKLIVASYDYAIRAVMGETIDPVRARSWIGRTLVGSFRDYNPEHVDELVDAYTDFRLGNEAALLERVDGMEAALRSFSDAGIRFGLATSKRRAAADWTLELAGLTGLIDVTVAAEDTDEHKPAPAPLLLAAERLGADGPTVYVGDAVVDVLAAKAAGMDSIAVTWGAGELSALTQAAPTLLVDSAAELVAAVLG